MLAFRHCSRRYSAAVRHIWNLPAKIYSIPVWRSWRARRARRTAPSTCCPAGEKALTALALVFAIFQLNPAPFCMLDEVDAPLDDANVGRYARLVKEMSEKVQFIYITHNKIAMEMADQLMGVTMHEPGCSRLVAVDVEEAVALAEA
ncbi:hypothetical protein N5K55_12440 [Pseudomonas aeruginosa]|nr:hypothetical protein [Pseudomonas aeruginosa]